MEKKFYQQLKKLGNIINQINQVILALWTLTMHKGIILDPWDQA